MRHMRRRFVALYRATATEARHWIRQVRASKNYGRAKRLIRDLIVTTVPAVVTVVLTWRLDGQ
ncbi:hypothetical protein ACFZB5_34390 [Streptomyces nodosus]|uniref:hypothetical protein n=1 Tax=Streptomyces nodosus TaxID=40318 RepID=UPI0036E7B2EC